MRGPPCFPLSWGWEGAGAWLVVVRFLEVPRGGALAGHQSLAPARSPATTRAETPGATQDPTSRPLPRRGARESQQQADPAAALNLQDLDLASPAKRSRRVRP